MVTFGEAAESPVLQLIERVIYSYPQVSGMVFEQRRDLLTRETMAGSN